MKVLSLVLLIVAGLYFHWLNEQPVPEVWRPPALTVQEKRSLKRLGDIGVYRTPEGFFLRDGRRVRL